LFRPCFDLSGSEKGLLLMRYQSLSGFFVFLLILGAGAWPVVVLAQPDIQSVGGVIQNGTQITIGGSGFGQGGEMISWDDFESGADGDELGSPLIGPDWTFLHPSSNTPIAAYSELQSFSGDKAAKVAWKEPGYSGYSINAFGWAGEGPYNTFYLSYWRYHDPSNLSFEGINHKQIYLYGNEDSNGHHDNQQWLGFMIPYGISSWHSQIQDQPAKIYYWSGGPHYEDTTYIWGRWDTWIDYEDSAELDDGAAMAWYNGKVVLDVENENLVNPEGGQYVHDMRIGHMFQGDKSGYTHVRSFFDNVYANTSRARIELGNAPVFEDCTILEIQVPADWTSNSVTANLTFSLFHTGEPVYLFVVDEDNVASAGYELVVGEGEEQDEPGVPGQPVRQ